MGDAAIWYAVEDDSGILRKISIGGRFSHLFAQIVRDVDIAQTLGGRYDEQHLRAVLRCVVEIGPFNDYALRNELLALENHVDRGGSCIIAEDEDRAFAAFIEPPERNASTLVTLSRPWQEIGGTPSGQLVLQGPSPEGLEERTALSSWSPLAGAATVSPNARHDWTPRRWCLLRTEGFLPEMLRAKEERNTAAIQHEYRRAFTFRMTFDMDIEAIDALSALEGATLQGTVDSGRMPHRGAAGQIEWSTSREADAPMTAETLGGVRSMLL